MTGTVDQLAYPLLLAARCSPVAADDRFRPQRHVLVSRHGAAGAKQSGGNHRPRLGTVARASGGGRAYADWAGQKGCIPTTVGGGCSWGVALTASADDVHLQEAYGVFAGQSAEDIDPEVRPPDSNTDGWASTRNAFQTLFPLITVVLCFLHGFLKIRDRCRKARELHRRVWDVYRAATAEEFRRLMNEFSSGVQRKPGPPRCTRC